MAITGIVLAVFGEAAGIFFIFVGIGFIIYIGLVFVVEVFVPGIYIHRLVVRGHIGNSALSNGITMLLDAGFYHMHDILHAVVSCRHHRDGVRRTVGDCRTPRSRCKCLSSFYTPSLLSIGARTNYVLMLRRIDVS